MKHDDGFPPPMSFRSSDDTITCYMNPSLAGKPDEESWVVATLSKAAADSDQQLWLDFKSACVSHVLRRLKEAGLPVDKMTEVEPPGGLA